MWTPDKVGVLSGGQKAKLQLAKMLLSGANLLLLDEPTNHLDIQAVEWLESFLLGYSGSYIVISHDRYFLDKVTNRTLEMEGKTVTSYKGNYSRYLDLRAEHRLAMERVYESKQKEIARLEGIIEQQRRWNQERNYVTIASKQKAIDRIEATLEKPEEEPDTIRFQFKASRRGGNDVLTAQDLSLSFHPGQPLFEHVGIEIKHGEKVFLIGPNGCGKTSLFKILLGQYTPDTGLVRLGAAIDVGYYEQSQLSLHDEKTVIDEIWDLHPQMTQTEVRSALAVFLFKGINKLADKIYVLGKDGARLYLGNYDAYLEQRDREQQAQQAEAPAPKVNLYKQRKERESALRKKRTALRRLEEAIEENEAQAAQLEEQLSQPEVAADYEQVTQLSEEIARLHQEGERLLGWNRKLTWTAEKVRPWTRYGCCGYFLSFWGRLPYGGR